MTDVSRDNGQHAWEGTEETFQAALRALADIARTLPSTCTSSTPQEIAICPRCLCFNAHRDIQHVLRKRLPEAMIVKTHK